MKENKVLVQEILKIKNATRRHPNNLSSDKISEKYNNMCFIKKLFLKLSQHSHGNTCQHSLLFN